MCNIKVENFSKRFTVRRLTEDDVELVYDLALGNPLYYKYCPPAVSKASILQDMNALPLFKTKDEKFYVGYFEQNKLVALLDLIERYPNDHTCYIGFFMMAAEYQGKEIGSCIIRELKECLKRAYNFIELGYVKGNPQCEAFWKKNGFYLTGTESEQELFTVVCMQSLLR